MSRSRERAPAERFAALRHPLFLGALALLLVNDHVLKGAKILPGAITGKLSDLAGMIVAPVLAAALVHARSPGRRAAAFAAAVLPFIAIKLSAGASAVLVAAGALVGLKLHIWQDPTDLVALVCLAPAWWLCASGPSAARAGRAQWALERGALAVSAAACVATSSVPGAAVYQTDAYLVNGLPVPVDVRVRWVDAKLDCPAVMAGDPTRMLGPGSFNLGITFHLDGHATVPLNRAAALKASTGDMDPTDTDPGKTATGGTCEVALIEVDTMAPQLLWWHDVPPMGVPGNTDTARNFWGNDVYKPGQVVFTGAALGTPGLVSQGPLVTSVAPSGCADTKEQTIQWSVPAEQLQVVGVISKIEELPDTCLRLTMSYPDVNGGAGGGAGAGGMGGGGAGGADTSSSSGSGGMAGAGGMGTGGGMAGAGGMGTGGMTGSGGAGGGQPKGPSQDMYLCIHKDELPFVEGDKIATDATDTQLTLSGIGNSKSLQLFHHVDEVSMAGITAKALPGKCQGDRLSCGGYIAPATLSVAQGGNTGVLGPGETLKGALFKLRVGRAEQVLVGREACESAYQTPGIGVDFLISQQ